MNSGILWFNIRDCGAGGAGGVVSPLAFLVMFLLFSFSE